jgi:hypothetical protein
LRRKYTGKYPIRNERKNAATSKTPSSTRNGIEKKMLPMNASAMSRDVYF